MYLKKLFGTKGQKVPLFARCAEISKIYRELSSNNHFLKVMTFFLYSYQNITLFSFTQ